MAIILLITYLFSIESVDDALNDPSGYPFIYVFTTAVNTAGVNGLTIMILILVIAANISWNASTARQTFAFARDNGLPFSKWIGHIDAKKQIPANSIALTCIITMLLSLINIGSATAFNAIISLQVCAIMMTYAVSVACVLYRRVAHPELIPTARWSLGKWGVPVNIIGLAYVSFTFFWSFWPNTIPVTLETFNWSVVLFLGVLFVCLVMYIVRGRKVYVGPVSEIKAARL
jgi:amino acid transporter